MGGKPLFLNGAWACVDCHTSLGLPAFCGRRVRPSLRCNSCRPVHWLRMDWLSGRALAATMIGQAVKKGHLARPSNFACCDCGKPAYCYDHRDYGQPMAVDPVCRSCNVRRGTAKPLNQAIVSALLLANPHVLGPAISPQASLSAITPICTP